MLGLYGFDIYDCFTGKAPIRLALAYINRLPFEPWSVWRAEQLGGLEHLGWSHDTYRAADQVDAIMANTAITAHMGQRGKPKMPEPVFRPKVKKEQEPIAQSLDDFDINKLVAMIGAG